LGIYYIVRSQSFIAIFFLLYTTFKNKVRYISRTKQFINRYRSQTEGIEIKITNTSVTYKDFEIYSEMKWTVFTEHKLYKNYFILIIDRRDLSSIIINRNEISETQFTEIFEFVKGKLPEKE
jgi:hypothetical protein